MKAAVLKAPKSKVEVEERKRPTPGPGEVLIRVRACGVCHGDLLLQQGDFPFARYPVVPGHEVAGEMKEVGEGVQWPKLGTRVGLSACFAGANMRVPGGSSFDALNFARTLSARLRPASVALLIQALLVKKLGHEIRDLHVIQIRKHEVRVPVETDFGQLQQ